MKKKIAHNGWISVEDRLPNNGQLVMISFIYTARYVDRGVPKKKYSQHRTCAMHFDKMKSLVSDHWHGSDEFLDHCMEIGEDGETYIMEGFYETMFESEEVFKIQGTTHWMPFPQNPKAIMPSND